MGSSDGVTELQREKVRRAQDLQGETTMPLDKYYGGHGEEVMADMKKRYGKRGERVFYATMNAKKKSEGKSDKSGRYRRRNERD